MLEQLLQDIRFGARMLRKNPGFTAVAVLTLALGIGANAAIFSLVNGILLRPLPYSQPERLVTLWNIGIPKGALLALQVKSQTMDVAGYTFPVGFNLAGQNEPIRLTVSRLTLNLLPMLGVNAELGRTFSAPRSTASLFVIFGMLALTLGCIGIYSVVSYSVAERTQEIGVRVAVGAQRGDVLKLVIGAGMKLAGIGMGIGLAGAAALTRLMESLLFAVKPVDAATYFGVVILLTVLAMVACYIPARRALRVDPVVALRYE